MVKTYCFIIWNCLRLLTQYINLIKTRTGALDTRVRISILCNFDVSMLKLSSLALTSVGKQLLVLPVYSFRTLLVRIALHVLTI